ncbi:hypothetical protein MHM98_02060 [Psychrobium sp. MM17-31]|uniref:hypothetical protein n=1 Tax=Psychrobium sp. MM17-31 TaxID=2917758 RepID=UPI001EF54870|nr:hypothetical protein [Psychrobium sp. MM17-31]MCG7530149.1 hypothetical protein [Psychrobium sp. MM17-31]
MITIDNFTIEKHQGDYENRPLKSALHFNGEKLNLKVSGYVIEKQFELPNYFLLLINWDCPFEEGCEIVVLNKDFKIVGNYSFTPFYHSYLLTSFCELSANQYQLVFNDSDSFELIVNYPKRRLFSKVVCVNKIN